MIFQPKVLNVSLNIRLMQIQVIPYHKKNITGVTDFLKCKSAYLPNLPNFITSQSRPGSPFPLSIMDEEVPICTLRQQIITNRCENERLK